MIDFIEMLRTRLHVYGPVQQFCDFFLQFLKKIKFKIKKTCNVVTSVAYKAILFFKGKKSILGM